MLRNLLSDAGRRLRINLGDSADYNVGFPTDALALDYLFVGCKYLVVCLFVSLFVAFFLLETTEDKPW